MKVTTCHLDEMRVLCVHHVGPYHAIARAFIELDGIVGRSGLQKLWNATLIAVYYDDPQLVPTYQLRADVGLRVPADTPAVPGLTELRTAAGRYARTLHIGPYTTLGDTWTQFWVIGLAAHNLRAVPGPSLELYRNTPRVAQPETLQTELFIPIAE